MEWLGHGITNTRFQSADAAGIKANDLPRLTLKWAFGFPGATSAGTQPVVAGGRVYAATAEGDVYVLDAKTGCVHWTLEVEAGIRSAITLDQRGNGQLVAYFGDQAANVYAVDAKAGKVLWKVEVDEHPHAAITAAPQLYKGRLPSRSPRARNLRWATHDIHAARFAAASSRWMPPPEASLEDLCCCPGAWSDREKHYRAQLYGPAGEAIWNTPTIDTRRNVLYVGTGNNFAPPATELSDSLLALDLNNGEVRWAHQVTENDIWNGSCRQPNSEAAECPDKDAPDFDLTCYALMFDVGNGRQLIVVGIKSGVIFGFDTDASGTIVWQRRVAEGSSSGGVFWGSATDGVNIYAANADFVADDPAASGGMNALDLRTGRLVWSVPGAGCANKTPCKPSQAAAVTVIASAAFSGTMDGRLRAIPSRRQVLWEYDTARDFCHGERLKASRGSMSNPGRRSSAGCSS
jgi:polyvinyl alcohol dehydrogenase (cytochrome)